MNLDKKDEATEPWLNQSQTQASSRPAVTVQAFAKGQIGWSSILLWFC